MESDYSIYTGVKKTFGITDYVFFAGTLSVSVAIGVFYAIKDKQNISSKDYLLGGRQMSVVPVSLSILVTSFSATTLLGMPAEVYTYNTMIWWLCLSATFGLILSAVVFVPFFYNLNVTSIYEYLEMRFGKEVRVLGSLLFVIKVLFYMSFVLYVPSLALNAATELNLWGSIVAVGMVVTVYTTIGGMKAVLWTDTFQSGIIMAGLVAALVEGSRAVGGLQEAWTVAEERSRIYFTDFNPDPTTRHSFWALVIGGGILWINLFADQVQIQRSISCPTVTKAKLAMLLSAPFLVMVMSLCCVLGVIMFAFYKDCHPVKFNNLISRNDQMLPLYIMDILGHLPGVPGLFISCLFSGSLSSLSSGLSALGAVIPRDLLQPCCCGNRSDKFLTNLSKFVVLGCGVGSIGLTFMVSRLGTILQATYTIGSITSGPLFGLFVLGMFFPSSNRWGAIVGAMTSLAVVTWLGMGAFITRAAYVAPSAVSTLGCNWNVTDIITDDPPLSSVNATMTAINSTQGIDSSSGIHYLYSMSYMWYLPLAVLIEVVVGLIVSFLTKSYTSNTLDPRLICPVFDLLCPCFPSMLRNKLRYQNVKQADPGYPVESQCCALDQACVDSYREMDEMIPRLKDTNVQP